MKILLCLISLFTLCSCANSYSTVSGVAPNKVTANNAAADIVSAFSQSQATRNTVNLHLARGDKMFYRSLERELRERGHSVNVVKNNRSKVIDAKESVDISYQTTNEAESGTYCLKVNDGVICRLYSSEGIPLSALTVTGIEVNREKRFVPSNLDIELKDKGNQVPYDNETLVATATEDGESQLLTSSTVNRSEVPAARIHDDPGKHEVKAVGLSIEENNPTPINKEGNRTAGSTKDERVSSYGHNVQWKETPEKLLNDNEKSHRLSNQSHTVAPSLVSNDELRARILKYVDQMPTDKKMWFINSQYGGENDKEYRIRLIRHAQRLNRMAKLEQ